MALEAFLKIEGIPGESRKAGHPDEIDILSFSFGASNPTTVGKGTGAGASQVAISSFNIMKQTDLSSTALFLRCAKGEHIPTAIVTCTLSIGVFRAAYDSAALEAMRLMGVRRRVVLVGEGDSLRKLHAALSSARGGIPYEFVGAVAPVGNPDLPLLGTSLQDLSGVLEATRPDELVLSENGIVRYASPSVERILGYAPELISGRSMTEFLHPDDFASTGSDVARLLRTDVVSLPTRRRCRCPTRP